MKLTYREDKKILSFRSSQATGRWGCNIKSIISKLISRIDILSISCGITLCWMLQDHIVNIGLGNGLVLTDTNSMSETRDLWYMHVCVTREKRALCHNVYIKIWQKICYIQSIHVFKKKTFYDSFSLAKTPMAVVTGRHISCNIVTQVMYIKELQVP